MMNIFEEIKQSENIKFFICQTFTGAKNLKPVTKTTARGVTSYIHTMGRKYGENASIAVGYLNDNLDYCEIIRYQA